MNVSELARRLNVSPNELREKLPLLGFDIGMKAIKVDDRTAIKIINNWRMYSYKFKKKEPEKKEEPKVITEQEVKEVEKGEIILPNFIVVKEFAKKMAMPVTEVLAILFKNGIMASMNEKIDYETAAIISSDLGFIPKKEDKKDLEISKEQKIKELLKREEGDRPRPPVVVVMGHVDHGKTKLLDAIRKTSVMESEAGGITQHIGAYQIVKKDQKITFIDTPGHEAFTAMRSRGARVADIAILVVAADDGVKPQTIEAIKIIEQAKLPMIVAINKIDKPEANIEKTKQELAQHNLLAEDWGGKIIMVPIAAKQGTNIDELLEMILLVYDMEKENITAKAETLAVGTIIEAHVDKGEGPVATVIVQKGTLRKNDIMASNGIFIGKVKMLRDDTNKVLLEAEPSRPAKILGLKTLPEVGDIIEVAKSLKDVSKVKTYKSSEIREHKVKMTDLEQEKDKDILKLNIILKGDVLGSVEAISQSLELIENPKVKVNIVLKALGNISEGDILRAEADKAIILGFNVNALPHVFDLASEKKVEIKFYKVIYDLIDDVKKKLKDMLGVEIVRRDIGQIEVLKIFKTEKKAQIVGGKVKEGKVTGDGKIDVYRGRDMIATGVIEELQAGKQIVKDCVLGQECGIRFAGNPVISVGDTLKIYVEEEVIGKL